MLADAKGGPIDYNGKNVFLSYKMPVRKGQEVEIEFMEYDKNYHQGIEVSIDQRKGEVDINGQKLVSPVFWTHTAPKIFSFVCNTKKEQGTINLWNVWQNIEHEEGIDAWIGNSGLYIERLENDTLIFYCSNGINGVNFSDLVFKIKLK